jgi:hypothetical protein
MLLAAAALLAVVGTEARAQATRADSAAVLLDAARRFDAQGRDDIAAALYLHILERFGDTAAADAVRTLRGTRRDVLSRGGRVELQVWGTGYGLWLGVAVPLMAGADEPEPYGLGLLLGGPVGFLASRAYAHSRPLTEGQARAITLGGTWGTWQGFGWAHVLDLGITTRRECLPDGQCFDVQSGDATEEVAAAAVVGGLAGIATGALLSRKPVTTGLATTVNFGSLWGTWYGFAAGVLADREDDALLAAALIGGNVGLIGTAVFAPRWRLSRNRARLISLAGLVGGLAGAGIDLIAQPDDEQVAVLIPTLTSAAGLAWGARATRRHDRRSEPEGPGAGGGALIRLDGGRLAVEPPQPLPIMTRDRTGRGARPALFVPILNANF